MGPKSALVVGAYGLALFTADAGQTWAPWTSRIDNPKGLHLYAVRRRDERMVIAGEQGLVLRSNDGGRSFQRLSLPYKGSFFALELSSANEIVVAGLRGNIWHTANDGADWSQWQVPMPASITATQLTADGRILFANQAGFVLSRRGDRMVPINAKPLPPLNGLAIGPGGQLLGLTTQGALALPRVQQP